MEREPDRDDAAHDDEAHDDARREDAAPDDVSHHGMTREDEDGGPIGIFPSWGWVYGSVIAYTLITVVVLYVLTVTLNYTAP